VVAGTKRTGKRHFASSLREQSGKGCDDGAQGLPVK
jgi:hypothetical protein